MSAYTAVLRVDVDFPCPVCGHDEVTLGTDKANVSVSCAREGCDYHKVARPSHLDGVAGRALARLRSTGPVHAEDAAGAEALLDACLTT